MILCHMKLIENLFNITCNCHCIFTKTHKYSNQVVSEIRSGHQKTIQRNTFKNSRRVENSSYLIWFSGVLHPKKREIPTFSRYVFRCYFCCTTFQNFIHECYEMIKFVLILTQTTVKNLSSFPGL